MRLWIGVLSAPDELFGLAIRAGTEGAVQPPWLLGSSHPATHAYVVWEEDGRFHRLDAQPSGVKLGDWAGRHGAPAPGSCPSAHFELVGDAVDIHRAHGRALTLVGAPYDFQEIAWQGLTAVQRMTRKAIQVLFRRKLPAVDLANLDLDKQGFICTHVATEAMRAAGGPAAELVAALPDRFPETLAQRLQKAVERGEPWVTRA